MSNKHEEIRKYCRDNDRRIRDLEQRLEDLEESIILWDKKMKNIEREIKNHLDAHKKYGGF